MTEQPHKASGLLERLINEEAFQLISSSSSARFLVEQEPGVDVRCISGDESWAVGGGVGWRGSNSGSGDSLSLPRHCSLGLCSLKTFSCWFPSV